VAVGLRAEDDAYSHPTTINLERRRTMYPPFMNYSPTEELEKYVEFRKKQEEEEKRKAKEKEKPKPITFGLMQTFLFATFSSLIVGPVVGLVYLDLLARLVKHYEPIITPLLSK
jgi:hypothetical protein